MGNVETLQIPRTIREVYDNLPEGTLAQLVENQLVMSPAPTYSHQNILGELYVQMVSCLKVNPIGQVILAPFDIHLDDENVFQPDLLFVRNENVDRIRESGLYGPPDLVIEILSPSTAEYDLNKKKLQYERHGVLEYWIIEPKTREVQGSFLGEGKFLSPIILTGSIKSRILDQEFRF